MNRVALGAMGRKAGVIGLLALATTLFLPLSRGSADQPTSFSQMFDQPTAIRDVKAASEAEPVGDIRCTYYGDLMVRETQTETPYHPSATLIVLAHGQRRPPCNRAPVRGGVRLQTKGFSLEGRKGGYLIWAFTNPNGASPFMVMDAVSGRILYRDADILPDDDMSFVVTLAHGILRLRYTRGYNAPCSMVRDPKGCWLSLVAHGAVSRQMPPMVRTPENCAQAYKREGDTSDDPSVVQYRVDVTIDATGKAKVLSRGAVDCTPLP